MLIVGPFRVDHTRTPKVGCCRLVIRRSFRTLHFLTSLCAKKSAQSRSTLSFTASLRLREQHHLTVSAPTWQTRQVLRSCDVQSACWQMIEYMIEFLRRRSWRPYIQAVIGVFGRMLKAHSRRIFGDSRSSRFTHSMSRIAC